MSGVQIPLPRPKALAKREFPSVNRIDVGNSSLPRIRPRPQSQLQGIWACHHRSRPTPEASLDCGSVAAALCTAVPILGVGASSVPCPKAPLRRCGRCVESTHRRPRIPPPPGRPDSTPRRRARNGKAGSHMDAFTPLPSPLPVLRTSDLALPILFGHLRSPRALSAFAVGPSQANRSQTRNKSLYW